MLFLLVTSLLNAIVLVICLWHSVQWHHPLSAKQAMSPTNVSIPVSLERLFDKHLAIAIGIGAAIGFLPVTCEYITMANLPHAISGWFAVFPLFVFVLVLFLALVGLVPALTMMLFRGTRKAAGLVWIVCVSTLVFSFPGISLSHAIRMQSLSQMAERSKPLIAAIKRFEIEKGSAPQGLEELVPKYISAIPATGIGAYPEYRYQRLENDVDTWELRVDCGVGLLNWDEFFYRPSKKYGKRVGGWVEPCGDWAYFHE